MDFLSKFSNILEKLDGIQSRNEVNNNWNKPFQVLNKKWVEVPFTHTTRKRTTNLLKLSDSKLLNLWFKAKKDRTTGDQFSHRGWYHKLYMDFMKGKKVLDVGCGIATDTITFAQNGAKVTFLDIAKSNLKVVERLCKILKFKNVKFLLLEDISSLKKLDSDYDVIYAQGSLHHAPYDLIKKEVAELLKHLKVGGRWIQLAYPKSRWLRYGKMPFNKWGEKTDGKGTPWAEWYDLPKLLDLLAPAKFEVILCQEFHHHSFIWFDLLFKGWEK